MRKDQKYFSLIGAAGYIAPRHMRAIKETGNELVAALDKNDSVGIMDSYFPEAAFFTEFERYDRHLEKLKRKEESVDFVTVCSPNYLHDSHIRFGLRYGADVICEKPLVLNPWNIDALSQMERESNNKVYTVLQLRLHPSIIELKRRIESSDDNEVFDIDLTYITSRGKWYYASWKGNDEKSGGIATNIGIHFFDMLTWVFGEVKSQIVHIDTHDRASGVLELSKAKVRWFLSINPDTLPLDVKKKGERTYRSLKIDDEEIEFSDGFADLHTVSYDRILSGQGFDIESARKAIDVVYEIRHTSCSPLINDYHPLCKLPQTKHPFK